MVTSSLMSGPFFLTVLFTFSSADDVLMSILETISTCIDIVVSWSWVVVSILFRNNVKVCFEIHKFIHSVYYNISCNKMLYFYTYFRNIKINQENAFLCIRFNGLWFFLFMYILMAYSYKASVHHNGIHSICIWCS